MAVAVSLSSATYNKFNEVCFSLIVIFFAQIPNFAFF